ncbi:hypothetical protein COCOBI_07-0460 [Coccomyxa sp. Obi]|nr:hypothetical protein COCOBI_07-0460 [Coccomyxa sp. Obi]
MASLWENVRKYADIMYNQHFDQFDDVWKVTDVQMPGLGGKIPLRLYHPSEGANGASPVLFSWGRLLLGRHHIPRCCLPPARQGYPGDLHAP